MKTGFAFARPVFFYAELSSPFLTFVNHIETIT